MSGIEAAASGIDGAGLIGDANPLRPRNTILTRYWLIAGFAAVVLVLTAHVFYFQTDWARTGGPGQMLKTAAWFLPNLGYFPSILQALFETFLIALFGTLLGMVIAIPVAVLAARNVTPAGLASYWAGRVTIVLSRSVHELIFALIFVSALGLGALPGMLALAVR